MNTRAVVLSAGAIVAGVLVAAASVFLLLRWWEVPAQATTVKATPSLPSGLASAPQQDLAAYRAEKERRLHGFGWVDAQRGIAHIPIEAAMDLLAAGGTR